MNAVVEIKPESRAVAITPMDMLRVAVEQNADIAKLEKLMELQLTWEKNQARKAFDAAISEAKAGIKPIFKNRKVDFTTQKGRTNYDYEDLAQIATQVDPILAQHGLSYRYRSHQAGNKLTVTCIVSHRDGHCEETTLEANNDESGNKNSIQAIGSAATFLQRYTLKLALGLSASKDDDGRGASKKQAQPAPEGYERWKDDMRALTDDGMAKLQETWGKSNQEFRRYVIKNDEEWWSEMKGKAIAADRARTQQ